MDELTGTREGRERGEREAWVCKSLSAPNPVSNNPSRLKFHAMKKSNSQEKVQTFMPPQKKPPCVYSFYFIFFWCVCTRDVIFLGDHLETKHLVIMGLKRTSSSPRRLDLMTVWTNRGQMCWKVQKSIEIHEQFGVAARTYTPPPPLRKPSFMHVVLGRPPSLLAELGSTDRRSGRQLHITVPHCSVPRHFHYTVILNYRQRWTGKDEWHIPASGAATARLQRVLASSASCHARQERAGQVSGQGAALILHKCGGNPLPPSWLKTIHLCRNGRRYPMTYMCPSSDYM